MQIDTLNGEQHHTALQSVPFGSETSASLEVSVQQGYSISLGEPTS